MISHPNFSAVLSVTHAIFPLVRCTSTWFSLHWIFSGVTPSSSCLFGDGTFWIDFTEIVFFSSLCGITFSFLYAKFRPDSTIMPHIPDCASRGILIGSPKNSPELSDVISFSRISIPSASISVNERIVWGVVSIKTTIGSPGWYPTVFARLVSISTSPKILTWSTFVVSISMSPKLSTEPITKDLMLCIFFLLGVSPLNNTVVYTPSGYSSMLSTISAIPSSPNVWDLE